MIADLSWPTATVLIVFILVVGIFMIASVAKPK